MYLEQERPLPPPPVWKLTLTDEEAKQLSAIAKWNFTIPLVLAAEGESKIKEILKPYTGA